MENKKSILSLIEKENSSLPKRGGNYVSKDSKSNAELEKYKEKLEELERKSVSPRHDNEDEEESDNHPFFFGESC